MNDVIKEILDFKENADYKKLSCDEIKVLKDYITNLQQENERLNNLFEFNMQTLVNTDKLLEDYKSRIEKAIKYIKENEYVDLFDDVGSEFKRNLLNILEGKEGD